MKQSQFKSQSELEFFLDSIPIAAYVYRGDRVIYVNKIIAETLGYTREEKLRAQGKWDK